MERIPLLESTDGLSETQREILRAPGAIKRLSVAVLVNDITTVDEAGASVITPRPAEEIENLRELVASAVGFDAERGDDITIRSMAFESLPTTGTDAAEPTPTSSPLNLMQLIQTGVLAAVALILGLFVVRPILISSNSTPPLLDASGRATGPTLVGNDGSIIEGASIDTQSPQNIRTISQPESQSTNSIPSDDENPVDRLRGMIDDRRDEAIQVLQSWIDEPNSEASK